MNTTPSTVAGIARAAMLVTLNIKTYSGRRKDKDTQEEVVASKGAGSKQAASVYKSLFAGSVTAQAIKAVEGKARREHYRLTLPWDDNGARVLPTVRLQEYMQVMRGLEAEFNQAVEEFIAGYDNLVRKAAFELGALFRREEYPSASSLRRKYQFDYDTAPLPTAGDFRVDVESDIQKHLVSQYEARMNDRLRSATQDLWERTYDTLKRLVERLDAAHIGDKKRVVIYDSLLGQAKDLTVLLKDLNVTGDDKLEHARQMLSDAIEGMTTDDLRESPIARQEVADKAKATLKAFDWSEDEQDEVYDGDLGDLDALLGAA